MSRTVIFDVGNVILDFDPMIACDRLSPLCDLEAEEIYKRIYDAGLERSFEEGKINGEEFTLGCQSVLGATFAEEQLRAIWEDMFVENLSVSDIVRDVIERHQVMLLSNTNRWHWGFVTARFPIISEVDKHVLSFRIGALKPDPRIYQAALRNVDHTGEVIFIDDIEANVDGARKVGMQAIRFLNHEQLRRDLTQYGVSLS